jgi:hypothetical protein
MSKFNRILHCSLISVLLFSEMVAAQAPNILNYQGRIAVRGVNFEGNGQFKFALVDGGTITTPATRTATGTAVITSGFVTSITLIDGGVGYTSTPTVTLTGGGGSGATATASLVDGAVTGFTITSPGSGYSSEPTVSVVSPPEPTATTNFVTYWSNDGSSVAGSEPIASVSLPVLKGLFSCQLGDVAVSNMLPIPSSVFLQSNLRLRIWFNDGAKGWQKLSGEPKVAGLGYNSQAISTTTLSRIVDEVAIFGHTGRNYCWDDFPLGPSGRNSRVNQPSLALDWDSSNSSLTTRSLTRREGNSPPIDKTIPINGYCDNIKIRILYMTYQSRQVAMIQFIYFDGSASGEMYPPPSTENDITIENPDPTKPIKGLKVLIYQRAGPPDACYIIVTPNYNQNFPRSVDLNLGELPSNTMALRAFAIGSASAGKTLQSAVKWSVVYQDGSTSVQSNIGDSQILKSGQNPISVRFSTIPSQLGEGSVDLTKLVVRFITD